MRPLTREEIEQRTAVTDAMKGPWKPLFRVTFNGSMSEEMKGLDIRPGKILIHNEDFEIRPIYELDEEHYEEGAGI